MTDEIRNETAFVGYGDYAQYCAEQDDAPDAAQFARYNRIASSIADVLCGKEAGGLDASRREAVHWQIRFMRDKGALSSCFDDIPAKESFGGYTVERRERDGRVRVFGMEVSPMMIGILRNAGLLALWI